ncbi:MAG: trans-AT polyketide synthase/acyltransferase/oxidoreductase domain-containing protein, partial [Colwellia sp.]
MIKLFVHLGACGWQDKLNQACVEAGASEYTRKLLASVEMADVTMAPAADMFEMGVKLQV